MREPLPVVVFSHLRWSFVFQRPQHLLSRLAASRPILFVEEPIALQEGGEPGWDCERPADNVLVCRPRPRPTAPGFADEQVAAIRALMPALLER